MAWNIKSLGKYVFFRLAEMPRKRICPRLSPMNINIQFIATVLMIMLYMDIQMNIKYRTHA